MKSPLASLLLLSTSLVAPAALAQTATPPAGTVVAPTTEAEQQPEQEVEVSVPGGADVTDIVVIGRNIPNVVRATPQVVSVLSSEDIARTGEGDIAGALQRVTGLSLVGNGFVYVRGLGDRYSLSLLNGSPLPSPEPLRRVVPLDIFPTNVIASSLVQKSFSANYPGEFGGGVINLTTRAVPEEAFIQFGGSVGFDTVTSSELGYVYDGGDHDSLGYDSGERAVPQFIIDAGINRTSVSSAQLTGLTNAETTLLQTAHHVPANFSTELSFGGSVDVGDVRLGVIAGGGFSNTWRTRDATQQVAQDLNGGLDRDFRSITTDHRALVNGLVGFGAEFGEHRIRFTNVYIHDTLKQSRLGAGTNQNFTDTIEGKQPFIEQNTSWFERQLIDSQLVGEFKFDDLSIDVRGAYANTKRNSPYERAFTYQYSTFAHDYINSLSGLQSATINFSELNEDLWSGGVDLTYKLPFDRPLSISAGYAYSDSSRSSSRYTFRYTLPGGVSLGDAYAQQRPDYLLSDYTILLNGIILQPTTTSLGATSYDASLVVHGGYAQLEGEVFDKVRATLGVRYETADQQVVPGDATARTGLNNSYWLPAATVTWNFAEDMQFRVHGSKTIARPQFRELARQLYQDFESDRQFLGNPFLVDSTLLNAEARYEWFFGRDQRITAAGFYKKINNPIEAVAFFTGGGEALQVGFSNAPSAQLYGGEIEFQKYVRLDALGGDFFDTRRLVLIANYTYTQSSISAGTELVPDPVNAVMRPANQLFRDGAAMVGQSDHLVNLQIGIEDTERLSQLTVLFNYASDRITNRGPVASGVLLPDLMESPGIRLDVVARQGVSVLGGEFELKFEGRNLTGTDYQEFQDFGEAGRVEANSYRLGRVFTVGISATF
jgi:hypothetical protein